MIASESEVQRIFKESVPTKIQESMIRCLFGAYRTAFNEFGARYHDKHLNELSLRYQRWIQFLADLSGMHNPSVGIEAVVKPYHTLLSIGQIRLTASSCRSETAMIRRSLYRERYAYQGQADLFEKNELPPPDARYYAILLHRPDRMDPRQPAIAKIRFPDKTLNRWITSIDLFAQNQSLVNELRIPREEVVEAEMPIILRKSVKEKTG